jgi:hypothetical protein
VPKGDRVHRGDLGAGCGKYCSLTPSSPVGHGRRGSLPRSLSWLSAQSVQVLGTLSLGISIIVSEQELFFISIIPSPPPLGGGRETGWVAPSRAGRYPVVERSPEVVRTIGTKAPSDGHIAGRKEASCPLRPYAFAPRSGFWVGGFSSGLKSDEPLSGAWCALCSRTIRSGALAGNVWVYPNFSTRIFRIFNNLLLWSRSLVPPSGTRRSVGSRWTSVHRPWTAVPLRNRGFTGRCGCPRSVHTLAACGEGQGLSTRSSAAEPSRTPPRRCAWAETAEILNSYVRSRRYCINRVSGPQMAHRPLRASDIAKCFSGRC